VGPFVVLAFIVSCSNSDSSTAADDPTSCGPGPYGKVNATVFEATIDGTTKTKSDVVITFDLCPTKSFTTGSDGKVTLNMTKNRPVITTLDHPDDLPQKLGEWQLAADTFDANASMIPKLFRAVIANELNADTSVLGLGIVFPVGTLDAGVPDGGPTDPCQRREDVTFSIPGQANAKITYFGDPGTGKIPEPDPNATKTTGNGLAKVNGLPEGTLVEIVATKAGCSLSGTHDGFTGRVKLEKGFVTTAFAEMKK
jgi:hypothetical protein